MGIPPSDPTLDYFSIEADVETYGDLGRCTIFRTPANNKIWGSPPPKKKTPFIFTVIALDS
jgi:hypothetical protein